MPGELIYVETLVAGNSLPIAAMAPLFSVVDDNVHAGDEVAEMCIGIIRPTVLLSRVPVSVP